MAVLMDLYETNAEGFIRELKQRIANIDKQAALLRPDGDFLETLQAYRRVLATALTEAEEMHQRNLDDAHDDAVSARG